MARSAFGRNMKALRESRGLRQEDLSNAIGVTTVSISNWERGVTANPKEQGVVDRIKEFFGVTDSELFGYADGFYAREHGLSDRPFGALPPDEPRRAYAPLYGVVHAGDADEPTVVYDKVPTPYELLERHPNGYWLEVEGDCMDRVYPPGCHVFVDPSQEPRDGSIAVVSIDGGDFVMRRLRKGASVVLLSPDSNNPEWEDIVVTGEHELRAVGTVVWFQASGELE